MAPILRNSKRRGKGRKEKAKQQQKQENKTTKKGMEVREKESQVWNKVLFQASSCMKSFNPCTNQEVGTVIILLCKSGLPEAERT